jgi:hypothetical protein
MLFAAGTPNVKLPHRYWHERRRPNDGIRPQAGDPAPPSGLSNSYTLG